jgi:hypothetical protein
MGQERRLSGLASPPPCAWHMEPPLTLALLAGAMPMRDAVKEPCHAARKITAIPDGT